MIDRTFWRGRKVFLTGHTGFKGAWLCLLLRELGADVTGYALAPPTEPSLFDLCALGGSLTSVIADVRNDGALATAVAAAAPEVIFHMAAQPLVRDSYKFPVETYSVNVMGTVNLLEAVRSCNSVRAVINVTSDKCYENREWVWGYRENEPLGGCDPYASSKACSELITSAYRSSYFSPGVSLSSRAAVASARAGNVVGGGDWAADRLIPDCVRAVLRNEQIIVRSPNAVRPWQHVLEPLSGYLALARKLHEDGHSFAEAWNFGPDEHDARPVEWLVDTFCSKWGEGASYIVDSGPHPHEASHLKLDCSKAKARLQWQPRWDLNKTLDSVIEWTRAYQRGGDVAAVCRTQITEYLGITGL